MKCTICENEMCCPLCVDTGQQRYWEGRWRDERALNVELVVALQDIHEISTEWGWGGSIPWREGQRIAAIGATALAKAREA